MNKKAKPNQPCVSSLVSEWERTGRRSRWLRQNTCLYFSLLLAVCTSIPTLSPRVKPRKTREAVYKRTESRGSAAIRKPVGSLVRHVFQIDALWPSCQQTADSPRFLWALLLGCSGIHQKEREVWTAVSVYVRGYVCVCALCEWGCAFVWKRS